MFHDATFSSNIIFLDYTKSFLISNHIFKIAAYNNINSFSKIVYCYIFAKYKKVYMEIKRDVYLNKLIIRMHNKMIKEILGS